MRFVEIMQKWLISLKTELKECVINGRLVYYPKGFGLTYTVKENQQKTQVLM